MFKRAFLVSIVWCSFIIVIGTFFIYLEVIKPGGYIPLVNPLAVFLLTYWFYLAATFIHVILMKKLDWNKWLTASIGVLIVYIIVITPLILDNDYFQQVDWKVPVFLIVQTSLLVFFDNLANRLINRIKTG